MISNNITALATTKEPKTYHARNRKAWRSWLEKNHAKSEGVWLISYRASTGNRRVSYEESVEEALCFGWIDSTMRPIDEEKYMQRFSPRKPSSVWSALNKRRIEKLQEQGLLTPAGIAAVERAKKNGSWSSLDQIESLVVPDDFQKALDRNKKALKNFQGFSPSIRKQFLYHLGSAKKAETRKARIRLLVSMAALNKKPTVEGFKR